MRNLRTAPLLLAALLSLAACEQKFVYDEPVPDNFLPLEPPAAGEGYQVHVPAFPIPAQFEREYFVRLPVGNTTDVLINRYQVSLRPGTHHLILSAFQDENDPNLPPVGVMRDQNMQDGRLNLFSNMSNTRLLLEAPTEDYTFRLPDGYAVRFDANATVDLNSHYFNKTDKTRFGEVYVNLYTVDPANVLRVLDNELLGNEEMLIPAQSRKTFTDTYTFDKRTSIVSLSSHTHKRGERFEIRIAGGARDGELIYVSEDWQHPVVLSYATPLVLEPGEGLTSIVTFNNTTNRNIRTGVTSEDEMKLIMMYYFQD
ncbi:MAG: hypothetical protein EAZ89_04935 [Bacteroidetes bacterium]|nr:MAG: hypothetical protein EAZ89_04935 [Bacteroidota bacterium]